MNAEQFIEILKSFQSKKEYEKIRRYFKADDEDNRVIGVRMKKIFDLAKKNTDMPLNEVEKLLKSPYYEARMGAVSIMDFQVRRKGLSEEHYKKLYNLYLNRHDQNPNAPDYEIEYARFWQETERIVFSKTLGKVEGKARILREVDPDEINKLKNRPGGDMAVGGAGLASTFIRLGLIDEYRLYIHPVVLGSGKPMFYISDQRLELKLVETQTFSSGVVMLKYRPAD